MFLNINFQYIKTPSIPPSYKEVSTFYYLTLLHHVNYVQKQLFHFMQQYFISSQMTIPCGLKHVRIFEVIIYSKVEHCAFSFLNYP